MENNTISSNFSNIDNKIELARELIRDQNFVQARKYLEELLKLAGNHPDINYLLAQLYEVENNFKKASDCYSNLLEFNPPYEVKYKIAYCFLDADEYERAYYLLKSLQEDNREDIDILEQLAHTARIIGKIDEAVLAYNKILEFDKNNVVALTQLSEIYYDTEDKMNHYLIKAKLNYLENMFSSSVSCLKKALNYSNDDDEVVHILLNMAKVLTEAEKYTDALEQYQFVLNMDPNNDFAQNQIEALCKKLQIEEDEEEPVSWFDKLLTYFNMF